MVATWLVAQVSMVVFVLSYALLHYLCVVPTNQQARSQVSRETSHKNRATHTTRKLRDIDEPIV